MGELLKQYFRIAFLMGRPQELPAGSQQMRVGLSLAVVTYMLALVGTTTLPRMLAHIVLDLGVTALALQLALNFVGHPGRFEQAFGGLCGASAIVNLAAIPIYQSATATLDPSVSSPMVGVAAVGQLLLLVWSLSLLGHVIRHTFDISIALSIGVAVVFVVSLVSLLGALLPPLETNRSASAWDEGALDYKDDIIRDRLAFPDDATIATLLPTVESAPIALVSRRVIVSVDAS